MSELETHTGNLYTGQPLWHSAGIPPVLERQDARQAKHSPPGIPHSEKVLRGNKKYLPGTSPKIINRNYESKQFKHLSQSFTDWMSTLGYNDLTVARSKNCLDEFFAFLEQHTITSLKDLDSVFVEKYLAHLHTRPNLIKGGSLSLPYINKHITALRTFTRYLHLSGQSDLVIKPKILKTHESATYLTREEIQALYKAASDQGNLYSQRDTAMLGIFYGCGLRASEGQALNISDLSFEKSLLFVRKGKNYTQRYVPVNRQVINDLRAYITGLRKSLCTSDSQALLLSRKGGRWSTQGMYHRLQWIKNRTNIRRLQEKTFGMHILRHSIATHLLQQGMKLGAISRFLGHKSLETTQKYTHPAHEGF